MYIFARRHLSRADQRENLHDGRVLFRTWVSPLLVAISLGISKWGKKMVLFAQLHSAYRRRYVS